MGTDGEGEAQLRHAPKCGLNRTRGFPFGYFFRTSISGNTARQLYCRTHDTATKEADDYGIPRWIIDFIEFLSSLLEGT